MPAILNKVLSFIGIEEPRDEMPEREPAYDDYDRDDYDRGYDSGYSRYEGRGRGERDGYERGGARSREDWNYEREERPSSGRRAREAYEQPERTQRKGGGKVVNHPAAGMNQQHQMCIYQMEDFDDTRGIIDDLLAERSVLINLESVDGDVKQRIVDMLSGASYALGASLKKAAADTYLLAPLSVEISGSYDGEEHRRRGSSIFGGRR